MVFIVSARVVAMALDDKDDTIEVVACGTHFAFVKLCLLMLKSEWLPFKLLFVRLITEAEEEVVTLLVTFVNGLMTVILVVFTQLVLLLFEWREMFVLAFF